MRYFFHVRDARGLTRDEEGTELCDLAAARVQALNSALDFAIEDIKRGGPAFRRQIEISDTDGNLPSKVSVVDIGHGLPDLRRH